jgi:acetylornithine aminotransferase
VGQLPQQPDRGHRDADDYERWTALAREHGFVLASDEAYSEIYFGDSRLRRHSRSRPHQRPRLQHPLQALLDARHRARFAAGDDTLIAAVGATPASASRRGVRQRAAITAGDETTSR